MPPLDYEGMPNKALKAIAFDRYRRVNIDKVYGTREIAELYGVLHELTKRGYHIEESKCLVIRKVRKTDV